ncbi:hypothetical protein RCG17_25215 [Neobacillus sp. PS3-12]|jgi:uncharacterized protein YneR|uniref:HesB/YadR/YfhF family protein n=1 Tax=Neobacillus sp. PS3-12 TaxID=3070677 RepID=UPI0027E069BD|nr:hypothetical protein [Neobacillus sp. PS3-12]WML52627.1 hypothetical protein RCG17_25215 [Neobacillus sp. PS3-12]
MLISIDERALAWFIKEFDNNEPISIRMFPQYAGFGQKNKEFCLGFSAETPTNAEYKQEMNGITFYYEENDAWFFDDTETYLTIDNADELQISFKEVILN